LHVLSLSLAFILSQDQTLRCLNCFYILAPESVIVVQSHTSLTVSIRKINFPILVLLVELCKSLKELLSLSFLDCGCKGKDFFLTSKFFGEKFSSFFLKPISGRLEIIAWPSQPHPLPKDTSTFPSFLKRRSLSKAGAKVYAFIITSKFYNDFF
ncbi:MAG: hypothetical protein U0O08_05335, partial [Parabacteroides distasonis]